jgi:hypothetical protein
MESDSRQNQTGPDVKLGHCVFQIPKADIGQCPRDDRSMIGLPCALERVADPGSDIAPCPKSATTGHSITLSARASKVEGTVMPSAVAVCKLMTRSNLVGCSTGMSATLLPRKI